MRLNIVVGVECVPIFQQSVDAELYEWLLRELKRRKARSVQDVIRQILRGAQAGQLAGSEVNEREYFKLISDCQSRYEPYIMNLIDRLIETKQVPDKHYRINWLGGFEINPRDQAAAELDKARSLTLKTNWMTINEIRQMEGLERLPGADVVLGLSKI